MEHMGVYLKPNARRVVSRSIVPGFGHKGLQRLSFFPRQS